MDKLSSLWCFFMEETVNLTRESAEKLILTLLNEVHRGNPEVLLVSGAAFIPAWR